MLYQACASDKDLAKFENECVQALMNKLDLKPANRTIKKVKVDGLLNDSDISSFGFDNVIHRVIHLPENEETVTEKVYIKNQIKQTIAVITVMQHSSADAALNRLIRDLTLTSAPLQLTLTLYETLPDGPGDLCIVRAPLSGSTKVVDYPRYIPVYFLTSNIVVTVDSLQEDIDPMEIARKIETMLKN